MTAARRDASLLLGGTLVLLLAWRGIAVPPALPRAVSPADFSVDRARAHVRAIAQAPHPTGSVELARVRRYILQQLDTLGLAADTVTTTAVGTRYAVAGTVTNILTRLPGTGSGKVVLLAAHYDGVAAGPAAADDASGVAILLETLRALRAGPPVFHDVVALFSDGEEPGLLGAAAFAAHHPLAREVGVMLNFEARGTAGRSLMFETSPGDLALVRQLARAVPDATGTSFLASLYRILPNDTDFSELVRVGIPGLNFAFIDGVLNYHTPHDDPTHLDPATLGHQGRAALALARRFGAAGPPGQERRDATFFSVPIVGLVVYPATWVLPLAALAGALLVAAIVVCLTRRRMRVRDALIGLAGLLATTVVAVGLGLLAWLGVRRWHAGLAHGGYPSWSGVYLGALTLLTATATLAATRLFRRWARPPGITAGASLAWVAAALACAVTLPGGSYAFAWPALFAASAIIGSPAPRWISVVCATLAGAVAILFVGQIVVLVFQGLGLAVHTITAIAILEVMVWWPLAEWLEQLAGAGWWRYPAAAGAASGALFATGLLTVRNDAEHPHRDVLVYSLDRAARTARWYVAGGGGRVDEFTRQFVGDHPSRVQPTALERLITVLHGAPADLLSGPAPVIDLPAPLVRVVADSQRDGARTLVLRVSSERAASQLLMRVTGDSVRASSVNGQQIHTEWRRRPAPEWRLVYANPGPDGILVRLELGATAPIRFEVADLTDGLPAPAGRRLEPRPPGFEPVHQPDATLVVARYDL